MRVIVYAVLSSQTDSGGWENGLPLLPSLELDSEIWRRAMHAMHEGRLQLIINSLRTCSHPNNEKCRRVWPNASSDARCWAITSTILSIPTRSGQPSATTIPLRLSAACWTTERRR
eukprot:6212861-Pleurochrysis_carterae.AAC.2